MGNKRVTSLPAWEFVMTKKDDDIPLIATDRAKWIQNTSAAWV